jgi:hypothetical protein
MTEIEIIYTKLHPEQRDSLLKTAKRFLDVQERKLFAVIELKFAEGKPAHGGGYKVLD